MKKWMLIFMVACLLLAVGCSAASTQESSLDNREALTKDFSVISTEALHPVRQKGKVPAEFQELVEKDLFGKGVAFADCDLTAEETIIDEENHLSFWQVRKLDPYGRGMP